MAKRKMSTFERLQRGKLNRKQCKELERRLQSPDPGLEIIHRSRLVKKLDLYEIQVHLADDHVYEELVQSRA
jgi:hypothetical protein